MSEANPFPEDDYTAGRRLSHARWVATLSDGTVAVDDEGRPGVGPDSSWQRLRRHCADRSLRVTALELQFRGVRVPVGPAGAAGYFFRRAAVADMTGPTYEFFVAGFVRGDGRVETTWYLCPSLAAGWAEVRDPSDEVAVGPSLIF